METIDHLKLSSPPNPLSVYGILYDRLNCTRIFIGSYFMEDDTLMTSPPVTVSCYLSFRTNGFQVTMVR